jgi:hypothetical protein
MYQEPAVQLPLQLTRLSLDCVGIMPKLQPGASALSQLSGLVNLEHLELSRLSVDGVPGGLPSQLAKLTCLKVDYYYGGCNTAQQFQHLSSLTALQQLSVSASNSSLTAEHLSGMQYLEQLPSLQLQSDSMSFDQRSTSSWTHLTALERLALEQCSVEPKALAHLPQLRSLSLVATDLWRWEDDALGAFLIAL